MWALPAWPLDRKATTFATQGNHKAMQQPSSSSAAYFAGVKQLPEESRWSQDSKGVHMRPLCADKVELLNHWSHEDVPFACVHTVMATGPVLHYPCATCRGTK